MRHPDDTFEPEKPDEVTKKTVEIHKNAQKGSAGSVENLVANKSMRLSNDFNPSHLLSRRLDDGKGPSCGSSRSNDGLPKDEKSLPSLREIGNPKRLGIKD